MRTAVAAICLIALTGPLAAQPYDPRSLIAAQREAMKPLAMLDGVWRGTAWTATPTGRHELTQTERVGPFLDGAVRVVEGRGYEVDGTVGFNALGVISYNVATKAYSMQSNAMGHSGIFPLTPTADGFVWAIAAGPGTIIRYTATVSRGAWREVGERITGDGKPVQIFEMNLKRIGDTSWPAADPVPAK